MSSQNKLIFLPLGGAGEIGMNMYLYGYGPEGKERFILVDLGVTFPTMDTTPGVDLIMADPAYIEARADRLDAIFITHAHEDHIGALGMLYPKLAAPVYARPFTAAVARAKMEERGQDPWVVQVVDSYPEQIEAGPFTVSYLPLAHSIPEAAGLIIDTPAGRIVHTGDFKLDLEPIVGEPYDPALFAEIAQGGIKALVCDSTNVFSPHRGKSESTLNANITELIANASGMMVATTFASNVARLKTLAQAGVDAGRSVCVLGRSMQRMLGYAHSTGVLEDFPPTIELEDVADVPRENLMLIVTGSQGEGRAASAQLARGKYLGITMRENDTFLFSSKTIPGNEVSVGRIINSLSAMGVTVIDDSAGKYHVSGHANRPDLEEIHDILNPQMLIPMHGEYRHLKEHKELGESKGIAGIIAPNGAMIDLTGETPEVLDHIETSRLYMDGTRLIGAFDGVVLQRIRMATRGAVAMSIIIEDNDVIGVWAEAMGLPDTIGSGPSLNEAIEVTVEQELMSAKKNLIKSDDEVERLVSRIVNRVCKDEVGKKPVSQIMINRLVED
ncbi:ribonuclease J [Amylibacter sp. SFDW26]|uniref:ribonuclease J n=1 Tax=Amylibacter sp. SFDW26 TaxID=2652722 RepID=UPI0012622F3E|nr:ribonuclease J [Amylibacter sp. SFDW26]KAB7616275.1 ribonuclease J [Amylibacter sp. SFDW26]